MSNAELTTVRRNVSISSLQDAETVPQALGILFALPGVSEAKSAAAGKYIRVRYDVAKLQHPALIRALDEAALLKTAGWWERTKRGWYRDQDCVIRDNARAKPSPCCSNPTSILAQSGKKRRR